MILLSMALAIGQTSGTTSGGLSPSWLERVTLPYQQCLFRAIDRQYAARRFSEQGVLSQCATIRRARIREAKIARAKIQRAKRRDELIDREFDRLDDTVWTIVGHVRARAAER